MLLPRSSRMMSEEKGPSPAGASDTISKEEELSAEDPRQSVRPPASDKDKRNTNTMSKAGRMIDTAVQERANESKQLIGVLRRYSDKSNRTDDEINASREAWRRLVAMRIDAVPELIAAMEDSSWPSRAMAVDILGEIGPDAKGAVAALVKAAHFRQRNHGRGCAEGISANFARPIPAV